MKTKKFLASFNGFNIIGLNDNNYVHNVFTFEGSKN